MNRVDETAKTRHSPLELLRAAYPAFSPILERLASASERLDWLAHEHLATPRERDEFDALIARELLLTDDYDEVCRILREVAAREKLRIAARELLVPSTSIEITARELSDLADATVVAALNEATRWAREKFGDPQLASGGICPFAVIGMGKLGGGELNAGSDIDLLLFYGSDDGAIWRDGAPVEASLHEYFSRVAQRFVATLDRPTEHGTVWRVDLRLRPEGAAGPLVNSLAAIERYYESWGRTWERAAFVRARTIAGAIDFGDEALAALSPFVWRRTVNPKIADEMMALLVRARSESRQNVDRDLKLGAGGIREVEFFVQSLQLIWGGKHAEVRSPNTLDALRCLRAAGFVTDREARELTNAYLALRRAEHAIQFASGEQTHSLPTEPERMLRLARTLGYSSAARLVSAIDAHRRRVAKCFASLVEKHDEAVDDALDPLWTAIDASDYAAILTALPTVFNAAATPDIARHIRALASRPDALLGEEARSRAPQFVRALVDALGDAADSEQATRYLATLFARLPASSIYVRALMGDGDRGVRAMRRLVSLFGSSAFLGEAILGQMDLLDAILFSRDRPSELSARRDVEQAAKEVVDADGDIDGFVGALRRVKGAVMMSVGLADLAGELTKRQCSLVLSALADAILDASVRYALREQKLDENAPLAIIAMGKLGGRELGYGSDLDLFFVYDSNAEDAGEKYARVAQRVLRMMSVPHGDGQGYELDTRLRPSGNQGLLVVSLEGFAKYHAAGASGASMAGDWERQALIKARACAGSAAVGVQTIAIAQVAAYERGAVDPKVMHHWRMRMEREIARERLVGDAQRYDVKLGRGGIADIEFAVQWLQMKHGRDARVRTTETESALDALESAGLLETINATTLRDGYLFLRRLEQRMRVLHGKSEQLLQEGAPGLVYLARRMALREGETGDPAGEVSELIRQYREVTVSVRAAYLAIIGVQIADK